MPWPTAAADAMHSFGATLFTADFGTAPAGPPAVGTSLSTADANWTQMGQVTNLTAPPREVGDTKVTHTRSSDKAHEYLPGWVEGGQCTLRLLYNDSTLTRLQLLQSFSTAIAPDWHRIAFAIQFPDAAILFWDGYLKSYPVTVPGADSDDPVAIDVTIKVSGDVFLLTL